MTWSLLCVIQPYHVFMCMYPLSSASARGQGNTSGDYLLLSPIEAEYARSERQNNLAPHSIVGLCSALLPVVLWSTLFRS